ncbi:hypothetical protein Goshw_003515 [Gossypium schwendimanii]|uniref:RNase H type-1 domain-containing protein n=1 Tax=Gossypium schwendimanii TaxID=34291 RepID=A0A7J9MFR2_GOSSC|nr:hypothetical protein [Gossypium schwendimanii]
MSLNTFGTDGAVQLGSGLVAARGVVRDKEGIWIVGYYRFLGKCSVFDAELWGILDGLKIIQRRGHVHVTIQTDSLEILRYIPREYNQVADCLAKQVLMEKLKVQVFDVPPRITSSFIDRDRHTGSFYA